MGDKASTFRDFGILPDDLQPPAGIVRCSLTPGRVQLQFFTTGLIMAFGLLVVWLVQWILPTPLSWVGIAATVLGFAAFIYLGIRRYYRWIELDGTKIRAQHLYTGRIVERSVTEIAHLFSIFVMSGHHVEAVVVNAILGKVKGMEIRFRDGRTPLRVMRVDPKMTNAEEFLQAVMYRMTEHGEIEPEIIDSEGKPLVRSVHWLDDQPPPKESNALTVTLVVFLITGLLMGIVLGGAGAQQEEQFRITSVPPQEISVADLIRNGHGGNRYVTVTNFQPGGYYLLNSKNVNTAYVALFPDQEPATEIKVVLSLDAIHSEGFLQQVLQQPRFTGVCSATEITDFGWTMGPELAKANPGLPLKSAWRVNELRNPPTAGMIQGFYVSSYIAFGLTILLAAIALSQIFKG